MPDRSIRPKYYYHAAYHGHPTWTDEYGENCLDTITCSSCNCPSCRMATGRLVTREELILVLDAKKKQAEIEKEWMDTEQLDVPYKTIF